MGKQNQGTSTRGVSIAAVTKFHEHSTRLAAEWLEKLGDPDAAADAREIAKKFESIFMKHARAGGVSKEQAIEAFENLVPQSVFEEHVEKVTAVPDEISDELDPDGLLAMLSALSMGEGDQIPGVAFADDDDLSDE